MRPWIAQISLPARLTVRGLPVQVALSMTVLPRRMETEDVGITVLHLLPPQLLLRADLNLKGQT